MKQHLIAFIAVLILLLNIESLFADTTTYSNRTAFENALTRGFTVIDTSENLGQTVEQLSESFNGVTFFGAPSMVRNDGLLLNGTGFFGATTPHVGMNFDGAVHGVGVTSNAIDGGVISIYSGPNGTGDLLGSYGFGEQADGLFGGIISTEVIGSVVFSCDYNGDLKCGLIDPIFEALEVNTVSVPLPQWAFVILLFSILFIGIYTNRTRAIS